MFLVEKILRLREQMDKQKKKQKSVNSELDIVRNELKEQKNRAKDLHKDQEKVISQIKMNKFQ